MATRFDFDNPQIASDDILMERLRARIARRPGRWRRRMRRLRERRDPLESAARWAA